MERPDGASYNTNEKKNSVNMEVPVNGLVSVLQNLKSLF